ncbi:MFS transporter [Paraburkholderia fungorum]|uniref:MFS transporter n=1 Tax=Paraburkholderia fungorum TaxID=134537 RepID=UPI0038BBE1AD
MLFLLTLISYIDRATLSFAIGPIAREFGLSKVAQGYLFSSFIWSYTLLVIPMGMLIDRFGSKRVVGIGMAVWSIATIFTGLANGFVLMLITRLVMGCGEAANNPAGAQVIREWVPTSERGMVNAIYNGGGYAGPSLCALAAGPIIGNFGWHALFYSAGALGLLWMVAWVLFFAPPERANWLPQQEREWILDNRPPERANAALERTGLRKLLTRGPSLGGIGFAMGCNVYLLIVFLTWMPSYLRSAKGLSVSTSGLYTAVMYGAALVISFGVGYLSDRLLRGGDVTRGTRRYLIACTMLLASSVLFAPLFDSIGGLIMLLSLSLGGVAATTSQLFALVNDLLEDRNDVGAAMGFVIVGGNVFGLMAPIVTGYVISDTGHYAGALVLAGALSLFGMIALLLFAGQPIGARWRGERGLKSACPDENSTRPV